MRTSLLFLTLAAPIAAFAACSSSDDVDPSKRGFYDLDSGTNRDAAILPEDRDPSDGGGINKDATVDASDPRDPFDSKDVPVTCADPATCAKQVVAGKYHFCALMNDGTAHCWGSDEYGALGGGSTTQAVAGLANATQLSAGRFTTCARTTDGTVSCWGSNSFGNLGIVSKGRPTWDEFPHSKAGPAAISGAARRVDVSTNNTCAVLANNTVECWGTNELAQLARPGAANDFVMMPGAATLDPYKVAQVAGSTGTMLAKTEQGEVISWAAVAGDQGFVGGRMTSISPDTAPNNVMLLKGVTSLAATESLFKDEGGPLGVPSGAFGPFPPPLQRRHAHACAIANGEVFCWGRSDTGALCTGLPDDEIIPRHAPIRGKAWPQQLALGDELTCARMTDGSVQCCGADGAGRLGANAKGERVEVLSAFFRKVESFKGYAVQVATSDRAVCALLKDGTVECWGANQFGELGTATPDETAHPAPVKVSLGASQGK